MVIIKGNCYAETRNATSTSCEILREMCIRERNLTITEVAKGLKIARSNLWATINEHSGISPELAVKLFEAFGSTSQFWINLQKKL